MTPKEQADAILDRAAEFGYSINATTALFLRDEIAAALLRQNEACAAIVQAGADDNGGAVSMEQRLMLSFYAARVREGGEAK